MVSPSDSDRRMDAYKLDGDLRDAYVELLSAAFAVNKIKMRYSIEDIASRGSSFMVLRSISAAEAICEYFSGIQKSLRPQAGPRAGIKEENSSKSKQL